MKKSAVTLSENLELKSVEKCGKPIESPKIWSRERTILLLLKRFELQSEFKIKNKRKDILWEYILKEIKRNDLEFPFDKNEIIKKFYNLLTTYKRIKMRFKKNGSVRINWEYYEHFEQTFGNQYSAVHNELPQNDSFTSQESTEDSNIIMNSIKNSEESMKFEAIESNIIKTNKNTKVKVSINKSFERCKNSEGNSSENYIIPEKKLKSTGYDDILKFLINARNEEKEQNLRRDRRELIFLKKVLKVEQQKIDALNGLTNVLKKIV